MGIDLKFLSSISTDEGIKTAGLGTLDIGATTRQMNDKEKQAYPNLLDFTYAKDVVVLVVDKHNGVNSLTKEQIIKIYEGKTTNWKEVGGNDLNIVIIDQEETGSKKKLLRDKIIGKINITSLAIDLSSTIASEEAMRTTSGVIGLSTLGLINMGDTDLIPIAIDGIEPNQENMMNEKYTLVRGMGFVILKEKKTKEADKFIEFIFSKEAKEKLKEQGFFPI